MEEQKKIRFIFTPKTDSAVEEIIKNFHLEEFASSTTIINLLAKNLATQNISEKKLIDSLQKDLEIPLQIAEQISKQIINNVVPFLEKVPEDKLKDSAFVEDLSKKIWGETKTKDEGGLRPLPKLDPSIGVAEIAEKKAPPAKEEFKNKTDAPIKKFRKITKSILSEQIAEPAPKTKQQKSGPDSYREPIE